MTGCRPMPISRPSGWRRLAALVHEMPRTCVADHTNAGTQRVPAREVLREAAFKAQVGEPDRRSGCAVSGADGVCAKPHGDGAGDYAVRGGIIDIYPPGDRGPVRLDLFGDVLDGARRFDPGDAAHHRKAD